MAPNASAADTIAFIESSLSIADYFDARIVSRLRCVNAGHADVKFVKMPKSSSKEDYGCTFCRNGGQKKCGTSVALRIDVTDHDRQVAACAYSSCLFA
jgi:hypothetical protein